MGVTYSSHAPHANEIRAYADSDWGATRSTTGFCVILAGAKSRKSKMVCLSSCEAELYALAELAIELIYLIHVCKFIGLAIEGAVNVYTDSKSAHDLCHRFTMAQNSKHIDRRMYKMRELRGSGLIDVHHISGDINPADLYTKILTRQPFEKHRKMVMNLPGDTGAEHAHRRHATDRWPTPGRKEDPGRHRCHGLRMRAQPAR